MSKYCFVTYMSNDRDLCAVIFNKYNFKVNLNSKYDFVCICTEDVTEETIATLQSFNIKIKTVNLKKIFYDLNMDKDLIYFLIKKHYFGKFEIFNLEEYDKCVFMDSDVLTIKNIDDIFDLEFPDNNSFYMVPKLNDNEISQNELNLNQMVYIYENSYNSGFIFYKPSSSIYQTIINCILNISKDDFLLNIFGDECIFNYMIHNKILNVMTFPLIFNVYPMYIEDLINNNIIKKEEIVNIHYILQPKPWEIICNKNLLQISKIMKNKNSFFWYQLWIDLYFKFKMNYLNNFSNCLIKNSNNNSKVVLAKLDPDYLKDFKRKQIDAKMFILS